MRVLVFTPLGPGGEGGVDRMMDGLREELARRSPDGVCVSFITTRGRSRFWPLRYFLCVFQTIKCGLLRTHDVWHINLGSFGSTARKLILILVARIFGQPYIVHLHAGNFREFWESRPEFYQKIIRGIFLHATNVVVLGAIWRELILEHVPECAHRIVVLPNATRASRSCQAWQSPKDKIAILFLGRLGPDKGIPELLEAFSKLSNLDNWSCVLAGDGLVKETRSLVDVKFPDRISVPGWVGPDEVERLLSVSQILVLPSHFENMPMSVVEAFAHGLAVVATPVGSIPDILKHGENGLLVPVRDAAALATALERLIVDHTLRELVSRNAKLTYQQKLTIESYVDKLEMVWRRAPLVASPAELPQP